MFLPNTPKHQATNARDTSCQCRWQGRSNWLQIPTLSDGLGHGKLELYAKVVFTLSWCWTAKRTYWNAIRICRAWRWWHDQIWSVGFRRISHWVGVFRTKQRQIYKSSCWQSPETSSSSFYCKSTSCVSETTGRKFRRWDCHRTNGFCGKLLVFVQDEVQGFRWYHSQATFHPSAVHTKNGSEIQCSSYCVISNCL